MALFNRKVDYALLILSYLYHRSEGGCARAIAEQFGLSRAFVANILKRLCRRGFVASQRGTRGGYTASRPADGIYLTELMDALGAGFHLAECCRELPDASCEVFGVCPIKGPVTALHHRVRELLSHVTLAELVTSNSEPVTLSVGRCQPV
jgi:Rrf2 family protein